MPVIHLSGREWLVVGTVMLVLVIAAPKIATWATTEGCPYGQDADYRIPYDLSSDYWLYDRLCEQAAARHEIAVIGDSVIWGHYVAADKTLSHELNAATGPDRFVNLGLDGTHPASLRGLLAYYGRPISGQMVLLHFNPLWISSEKHDLSTTKEFQFNHSKLVPQFIPKIPCYRASFSQRMNAVVERYVPLLAWTNHLRIACFDGMDLPAWTIEHPYEDPLTRIADSSRAENPQSEIMSPRAEPRGRNSQSVGVQWVPLEKSVQWRSFQRAVGLLKGRKNQVFVLVGPFNENMLNAQDAAAYDHIKKTIEAWLTAERVGHWVAPALPARLYADLSHPVAEGYTLLAQQLISEPSFTSWLASQ